MRQAQVSLEELPVLVRGNSSNQNVPPEITSSAAAIKPTINFDMGKTWFWYYERFATFL
ncbi:hypothetical protein [Pontibacter qinzhouensis]|uniref:hypothetical protein n=1 Tax=Pontibacter qinzhouensis TaxID=2603253 RepID=UPI00164F6558|nr:hypothetical protein [Pontibacter qinzhouensis]